MCCRFVFVLVFMCVADTEARVVKNFDDCSRFFFKGIWPDVLKRTDRADYKHICQEYDAYTHFATLYMLKMNIPLFSAYRLDHLNCQNQPSKRSNWFVEPQLYNLELDDDMQLEGQCKNCTKVQAANEDYRNTNYDKGHLNPASYQCDVITREGRYILARTATFTLTNAVPQDPCFNRIQWKNLEQLSKSIMSTKCSFKDDQRFFVTGVFTTRDDISIPFHYFDVEEDNQQRVFGKVHVPFAMWTAACCYHSTAETGFSFGYIVTNDPEKYFTLVVSIPELQDLLYDNEYEHQIKIFSEDCFPNSRDSTETVSQIKEWLS